MAVVIRQPLTQHETRLLQKLMKNADAVIPFDCADPHAQFAVPGWFLCPKGSLVKPHDVTMAS